MSSYEEHIQAEALLRSLQVRDRIDADWKKTAQKLKDALEDHIHDEETKVFMVAQQMFTAKEAEMLGTAFVQMKPGVQKEGILKTTFDLLVNLMPPRLSPTLREEGFEPRPPL
jgi:hemerythrin-like domain-containing protein